MNEFKISFDSLVGYNSKPRESETGNISNRVAQIVKQLNPANIKEYVDYISTDGHTFCPATFRGGKRSKEHFEQSQLFTLDFDGGISFDVVKSRADEYDIPVLFAYETFNSESQDRFRVCFLNDVPIYSTKIAEIILKALLVIFHEADPTSKDIVKMYYGSTKGLIYFDDSMPKMNIVSLLHNMIIYLKDRYKDNNYGRYVKKFSEDTGVALTSKNLLDVTIVDELPDSPDTKSVPSYIGAIHYEKKLQNSFIYINGFCNNFSNSYYRISFKSQDGTNQPLGKIKPPEPSNPSRKSSQVLNDIRPICQLFREFEDGTKRLKRDDLFGLATILVHIDTGLTWFLDTLHKHSYYYDHRQKYDKWDKDLKLLKQYKASGYKPKSCVNFCPHRNICSHGTNILSTAKPKYHTIQKLANHNIETYPIDEIAEEFRQYLMLSLEAGDNKLYVINSPTGTGKSTILMDFLKKNPHLKILVAFSTNELKNQWYDSAVADGVIAVKSPSLVEWKDKLPVDVWNHIDALYKSGMPRAVTSYIEEIIAAGEADKACLEILENHRKAMIAFYASSCHAFITHSLLVTLDYWTVKKYDAVIFDEDPILNCMMPNQIEILITELNTVLEQLDSNDKLAKKIRAAVGAAKTKSFFDLPYVKYEDAYDAISTSHIDIASFCQAEVFYSKKKTDENTLAESCRHGDSIVFFKLFRLNQKIKFIVMSATADEKIYKCFFGAKRVEFYQCKNAEIFGAINQYDELPMSRAFIDKNPGVLEELIKFSGFDDVITFKKYNKGKYYYGKTTGVNTLTSHNLTLAGTPHQPEWLYKLFAYTIGWKNPLDENREAKMRYQRVNQDGFIFWFMTFDNDNAFLRHVQFWIISSELIQSIGRSRVNRNPSIVNVFSSFPLLQAEHKKLPKHILDKYVRDKD